MEFDMEKIDAHLEKLEKEHEEKLKNIKEYSKDPEKMKAALNKILEGKRGIDSDSFLYDDSFTITKEEFDIVYATLETFLGTIGKLYNREEFSHDVHFPTSTGHLMFMGKVITIETIYGQGVISSIFIEGIELACNLETPISSFSEFEKSASKAIDNQAKIQEVNETIADLEETIMLLVPSLELDISKPLKSQLKTTIRDLETECTLLAEKRKSLYS